jgi:DNA-binding beta-propeller fold protein YncE
MALSLSLFGAAASPSAGTGRAGGGGADPAVPSLVVYGLEAQVPFNSPRGIALSAQREEIYLANTGAGRLEIFDFKGRPKARFLHRITLADGTVLDGQPRAVAVDRAGRLLLVDNLAPYVDVLDYRGRSIARFEPAPPAASRNEWPGSIAVAADGTIFVAARGDSGRVCVFGPDFRPAGCWGVPGSEPGRLSQVTALAATPEGNLVVTCTGTSLAVQIFDPKGSYLKGFGRHDVGNENFSFPSGVAVTDDGRIWVTDEIRQVIKVFDSNGGFVAMFGGLGKAPGSYQYPSSLASDGKTRLAVAEREGDRFQILTIR